MNEDPSPVTSRRDFLKKASAFSLAALGAVSLPRDSSAAPVESRELPKDGVARGRVFLDSNNSGAATGQSGLSGMLVSNGVDIVKTDSQGRYEIPVAEGMIIYVIKPRNYMTAIDSQHLPRFYYIHKPEGSPDEEFIYKGVEPTGPLPESIDFPLYESPEPDEFEVLVTADPQPYNLQHLKWYAATTTREFQKLKVSFGIALGDLVGDHLDLYEPYNQINALTGFPWYNVFGNHDMNFMSPDDRYTSETFQRVFGPTDYAFQYGQVHFIVLNNVYWEGFTQLRQDGWPRRGQYRGHLRPRQLQFVRNYLEHAPTEDRIVICTHIPMTNAADFNVKHETPEFTDLLKALSTHPHTMSFSGHTHINANYLVGEELGYKPPGGGYHHHCNVTAPCGSWYRGPLDHEGVPFSPGRDGSPKGYSVVRFEGGSKYNIRFKGLGFGENHQLAVSIPSLIETDDLAETEVQVNVFNSTAQNRLRMRIDGGSWTSLEHKPSLDATYIKLQERSHEHPEAVEGALPNPIRSNHHWVAHLPADLPSGWHELEVESVNQFGETWTARQSFLVTQDSASLEPLNQGTRQPRET